MDCITIPQEPRLKKSQGKNWKSKQIITKYPTGNITEPNELIDAAAKVVCNKIGVPRRNTNRNTKPGLEIRLEGQLTKLRQLAKLLRNESMWWKDAMKTPK